MFKKILQSLSLSQSAKKEVPKQVSSPLPLSPTKPAGGVLNQIANPALVAVISKSPEDMCEITSKMSKDQIQTQLKLLYRRYNRSASSLDPKIRLEADAMLTAIVMVREKNFGEI